VYAQAVDQTGVAAKGIASGTPRGRADAVTALSTVEDAPGTCEQGFQDLGLRSPLASEDARFRKDASIALSVTAAL
jgi:hypothetical protein